MTTQPILIAGEWTPSSEAATFQASNPISGETSEDIFPISTWADCDAALDAAAEAAKELRHVSGDELAKFLYGYAAVIERRAGELVEVAHAETGLPVAPRLREVELVRTTTQLRQGAAAARDGSWQRAVIDTANKVRSHFAPIGPVVIFGPNNFPFAFQRHCRRGSDCRRRCRMPRYCKRTSSSSRHHGDAGAMCKGSSFSDETAKGNCAIALSRRK